MDDISFELRPGEIFGFLGQNGAGKSTTIKCLTGILPFEGGSIEVCGYDIQKEPIKAKMNMGYVPRQPLRLREADGQGIRQLRRRPLPRVQRGQDGEAGEISRPFQTALCHRQADQGVLPRHEAEDLHHRGAHPRAQAVGARRAHDGPRPAVHGGDHRLYARTLREGQHGVLLQP